MLHTAQLSFDALHLRLLCVNTAEIPKNALGFMVTFLLELEWGCHHMLQYGSFCFFLSCIIGGGDYSTDTWIHPCSCTHLPISSVLGGLGADGQGAPQCPFWLFLCRCDVGQWSCLGLLSCPITQGSRSPPCKIKCGLFCSNTSWK